VRKRRSPSGKDTIDFVCDAVRDIRVLRNRQR
jgi:hypothetical protein